MRRRVALAIVVLVLGGGAACGSDDDEESTGGDEPAGETTDETGGETVKITAADISFSPTEIQLEAGKTVVFEVENTGQLLHNLTIEELDVDGDVEGGKTVIAPATPEAGTYTFVCKYHPGQMTGTITVT